MTTKSNNQENSKPDQGKCGCGVTTSFGTYQVQAPTGAFELVKNPQPIQEKAEPSNSESEEGEEVPVLEIAEDILGEAL